MDQNNNYNQPQNNVPPNQGYTPPQQNGYYQQPQQGDYYQQPQQNNNYQQPNQGYYQQPTPPSPQATPDAMDNKGLAALCYLSPLMVILALVANGKSPFIRYHANQGLSIDILFLASSLLCIIPVLGWIAYGIISVATFIFRIMGILNATKLKAQPMPIVGYWSFIK